MGHTAYQTEYHIVWVTKYRRPILNAVRRKCLAELLPKILAQIPACEMVECNILCDHVHTVVIIPPKYAVKDVVGRLKGISSSKLKEEFDVSESVWSPGYFVRTVGVPEEKILSYIRNQ
jgi:putative transposase